MHRNAAQREKKKAKILELGEQLDLSYNQIAKIVRCSSALVASVCRRAGLRRNRGRKPKLEIAASLEQFDYDKALAVLAARAALRQRCLTERRQLWRQSLSAHLAIVWDEAHAKANQQTRDNSRQAYQATWRN